VRAFASYDWGMRNVAQDLVIAVWVLFAVVWAALAFITKRTVVRRGSPFRLIFIVVIVAAVAAHPHGRGWALDRHLWLPPLVVAFVGAIVAAIGVAFAIWARITIGRNWSGSVTLKKDHELQTKGPYALVRHPIYTGLYAMCLGTAITFGEVANVLVFVIAVAIFTFKIRSEETLMCEAFPNEYPSYRERVKSVIPFLI
jgi:protein-S-isoprenylcysteine O-methyltransferase Ste14